MEEDRDGLRLSSSKELCVSALIADKSMNDSDENDGSRSDLETADDSKRQQYLGVPLEGGCVTIANDSDPACPRHFETMELETDSPTISINEPATSETLVNEPGEFSFDGTLLYSPQNSTLYIVDEAAYDLAINRLPIDCRHNTRVWDNLYDDGNIFDKVVRVSDSKATISGQGVENDSTIQTYELYDFHRDDEKDIRYSTGQRILMCLACKLSFDKTKHFVNHAVLRHELVLLKAEQVLLDETSSAVLMKKVLNNNETSLYFLSPKSTNVDRGNSRGTTTTNLEAAIDDNESTKQENIVIHNEFEEEILEKRGTDSENRLATVEQESMDPTVDMSPVDIARTVMLASELSASRLLQQVSQNARGYQHWNSKLPASSSSDTVDQKDTKATVCGVHGTSSDGKTGGGVECPKCDVVLGSSRSLGGHMTMTHSRNSCKTLKCPKCNWHYKYPETLEIHMKEKHPENEVSCVYCITNQAHPRLSRGETYTCGYKPFRCDICKYSTTTKGNLSIHMQSDKHLNNVQELQQGKLMAQAQAPASFLNFASMPGQISPLQAAVDFETAAAGKAAEAAAMALAQSCATSSSSNVTTPVVKNKPSWRCDVCSYETNVARNLRIHMTSEKHAHNMSVLQQNMKQLQQTIQGFASTPVQSPFSSLNLHQSPATPKENMSHQYGQSSTVGNILAMAAMSTPGSSSGSHPSTSTSTSMSEHLDAASAFQLQAVLLQKAADDGKVFQCCVCMTFCANELDKILAHIQRDRSQTAEGDITSSAGQYYCNLCRYTSPLKANFQLHTKTDKHLQRLQLVNHVREGCQENQWRLKYLNPNNPVQLRCCACNHLVNSFHKMQMHTSTIRHKCFLRAYRRVHHQETTTRQEQQIFYCTLCNCGARTKRDMLNHLHSSVHGEHVNRLGSLMDVNDGGVGVNANESDVPDWIVVKNVGELDDIQMAESCSDDAGNNSEGIIRMNECPEARSTSVNLEWNRERFCDEDEEIDETIDGEIQFEQTEMADDGVHCCSRCSCIYETETELYDHYTSSHADVKRLGSEINAMALDDDARLLASCSDDDKFHAHTSAGSFNDEALPNNYDADVSSNTKQRAMNLAEHHSTACPLCQKECRKTNQLELHLAEVHNVSSEGINRLLSLIPTSGQSDSSPIGDVERPSSATSSLNSDKMTRNAAPCICPICSVPFKTTDDLYAHQSEVGHIEMKQTPNGLGYLCWWKGCNQYFKTLPAIQTHVREIHVKRPQQTGITSDRHLYRYRCSQCSQAYRTEEKFQEHQMYHQMRASMTCAICSRSFRSIEGLRKHVETTHINAEQNGGNSDQFSKHDVESKADTEEDEDEVSTESPLNATGNSADDQNASADEMGGYGSLVIDEQPDGMEDYLNSQVMAEKAYTDPNRKFKCHRCKVAYTRQSYLSIHNRTVTHRRGEKDNPNLEKFMDPNRPYKCDVCMESFTQKNILLVHKNSVTHIQKLKKSLQDSYPNGNFSVDMLAAFSKGHPVSVGATSSSPSQSPMSKTVSESSPVTSVEQKSASSGGSTTANKRYKCTPCDKFVTESTLEIHLRSVKHQSRTSKLPIQQRAVSIDGELKSISGDKSDSSRSLPTAKQLLNEAITKRNVPSSSPVINKADSHSTVGSTPTFSAQDAAAVAAASFQSAAALFSMAGLGPFLAAYQDLPGNGNAKSSINECPQCKKTFQNESQLEIHKEKCLKVGSKNEAKTTAATISTIDSAIEQAIYNSRRSGRGTSFKRLLEDYGFEVVMQFNEMQPQKRLKTAESLVVTDEAPKPVVDIVTKKESDKQSDNIDKHTNVPEMKKCLCPECTATFTSVWVLKAHMEQMHGKVVPLDFVEEISEEFKQVYEKKYSSNHQDSGASKTSSTTLADGKQSDSGTKTQSSAGQTQNLDIGDDLQQQQHQQLLALNAMMQQFAAAAQFPAFATNPAAAAAAMGMSQFPFMGLPFSPYTVPNPFLPMMVPHSLDQLAFNVTPASAVTTTPNSTSTAPATSAALSASSAGSSNLANVTSSFMQPPAGITGVSNVLAQGASQEQTKRARTRITDDQLKVLREYFDINNSPSEEQIVEMSRKSGLPLKVIKHWFRNTLFKERQRSKDSPYNFNIPPSLSIDLEQYEKTGEAKIIPLNQNGEPAATQEDSNINNDDAAKTNPADQEVVAAKDDDSAAIDMVRVKEEKEFKMEEQDDLSCNDSESYVQDDALNHQPQGIDESNPLSHAEGLQISAFENATSEEALRQITALSMQFPSNTAVSSYLASQQSLAMSNSTPSDIMNIIASAMSPGGQMSSGGGGRRANRTRFTETQLRTLQLFFEQNAYPKDDDLECLSQQLSLSPRVIVVWFQNARQKARKLYENQPDDRFQRTPGLNYQCKGCKLVFQRYYELIKHQQAECFKDEMCGEVSMSPTPTSSASTTPKTSLNPKNSPPASTENDYRCAQCNIHYSNASQFSEHLKIHASNPLYFGGEGTTEPRKRSLSRMGENENMNGDGMDYLSDDQDFGNSKRQRTQYQPEQLDMLYKCYVKDTNPSSKSLEKIAQETGLSKKVVQVWFQNTRARDRRGQLNDRQFFNKRCPFCGILYHSKQTMEAHLNGRHSTQLRKTNVDIDTLPDAEEVPTITTVPVPEALLTAARSGNGGNELAQSMLNFGMVPGTTTVPAPSRNAKTNGTGHEASSSGSNGPLDLSRAVRNQLQESSNRPSSCEKSLADEFGRLVAPGTPSTGNSNEEAISMDEFDDSRSAFDHDSPSPHHQVLAALARPQKRFRTHLTPQQIKVMKHLFVDHRTPTMSECETLGQELGLHRRVVQVWFQNSRAKVKKSKPGGDSSSPLGSDGASRPMPVSCELCNVTYGARTTMQDHLFSKGHLEKIKAISEGEDDGMRSGSPRYFSEQKMVTSDELQRPTTSRASAVSSSSSFHQSRSQQKHKHAPQKRQQQQLQQPASQDISSSQSSSMAQNFLPYVYAAGGLPQAYYAGLASMYANVAGMTGMYDPATVLGTPVHMLQIPQSVMRLITATMERPRETSCRFTQDGMTVADLSRSLNTRDRAYLTGTDVEVGWACRSCTTVFQTEALFSNHQQMICQTTEPVFRLIQTHYECRLCSARFGTQDAFKSHCQSQEHVSKAVAATSEK